MTLCNAKVDFGEARALSIVLIASWYQAPKVLAWFSAETKGAFLAMTALKTALDWRIKDMAIVSSHC